VLRAEDVQHAKQTDLDKLGIARRRVRKRNARAIQKAARDAGKRAYGETVSPACAEEEPGPELIQLKPIAPAATAAAAAESREEVGSFGD